ncbi:MAG: hypothetical protein ACRBI6_21515, partial [Acidimicrobiales bacterium]
MLLTTLGVASPASARHLIGNEPVVTVAGTGTGGAADDAGSTAAGSQLFYPYDVAVDHDSGSVYVLDTENHRIRRIDPLTGLIATVAGTGQDGSSSDGTATGTELGRPRNIGFGDGHLYISDFYNYRVLEVDVVSGLLATVAGTGGDGDSDDHPTQPTALGSSLDGIQGVAIADGYLYIADSYNNRIRSVDLDTGLITTIAGSGDRGFIGDGGPATDAELSLPGGVAVDNDGHLYIADSGNHAIRRLDIDTGL